MGPLRLFVGRCDLPRAGLAPSNSVVLRGVGSAASSELPGASSLGVVREDLLRACGLSAEANQEPEITFRFQKVFSS